MSAIDLEPKNPETYLHVSRALNQMGDPDAAVCVDGVCAVPRPEPQPEDAERRDDSADAGPGGRVPVQR